MGSDDHHDHGPHQSEDPRYTETWYWNLVDPETRCVFTLHCSWLPALGRGQHTMGVLTPQGTRRERVDTTSPLSSEVATVDIVEPWARARIRSTVMDVDIEWNAFHPAVDFGAVLHMSPEIQLDHFEGGGRGHGRIMRRQVSGSGFRDRSFGPRNMRGWGRHWAICVEGLDADVFLAFNSVCPADSTYVDAPNHFVGCIWKDGAPRLYQQTAVMYRHRDGSPMRAALPDGIDISLDLRQSFGDQRHIFDPNSGPRTDETTEPVYGTRDYYLVMHSPQLGPLIGFFEEGALWVT
jgi:hypothetical protein